MEKRLTIFTPTFNRAYILNNLYKSLLQQTSNDFNWMIVDDGSTDNTKLIVDDWMSEGKIDIIYYHQENSGKMAAHNFAVEHTKSELFLCVDSDDYLVDNAVELLIREWDKNKNDNTIGVIARRGTKDGKKMGNGVFPNVTIANLKDFFGKTFTGDTSLCFETNKLKKYKFPIIEGEKFISESYLYDQINRDYDYIIYDEIIIVCEYRPDGYTMNMDLISFKNPIGRMYHEVQNLKFSTKFSDRIKACTRYNIYKNICKHDDIYDFKLNERLLMIITSLPGKILYLKKKKRLGL